MHQRSGTYEIGHQSSDVRNPAPWSLQWPVDCATSMWDTRPHVSVTVLGAGGPGKFPQRNSFGYMARSCGLVATDVGKQLGLL